MTILHALRLPALCACFLTFLPLGASQDRTATIHLHVTDEIGNDVAGDVQVQLFENMDPHARPPRNLARSFRHNVALRVPFGVYHLRVNTTGFYTANRDVEVFQPEVWVVTSLKAGEIADDPWYRVVGRVLGPIHANGDVWLRLVGADYSAIADASADVSGHFHMTVTGRGKYVLITKQGKRILAIKAVTVPLSGELVINIGGK